MYPIDVAKNGGKSLDGETQARVSELLRAFINDVGGQAAAAKAIGISQGYLSEVLSGNRGGGGKLIRGLAKYRPEIAELMMTGVSRSTALDSRYPNRDEAVRLMVKDGAGSVAEIVQAADAFAVALKSDSDLTTLEWVRNIERSLRDMRRGHAPAAPVVTLGDEGIGSTYSETLKRKKGQLR